MHREIIKELLQEDERADNGKIIKETEDGIKYFYYETSFDDNVMFF